MREHPADDLITLRQWANEQCEREGITDDRERERRWKTIQRWPKRKEGFPQPVRPSRGTIPGLYSRKQLDEYAANLRTHRTDPEKIALLRSMEEPMTLSEIATALHLHVTTLDKAREASLGRVETGSDPAFEVPEPVDAAKGIEGGKYNPAEWAFFWENRPGQGRRT